VSPDDSSKAPLRVVNPVFARGAAHAHQLRGLKIQYLSRSISLQAPKRSGLTAVFSWNNFKVGIIITREFGYARNFPDLFCGDQFGGLLEWNFGSQYA
jgi:hypothetical protein